MGSVAMGTGGVTKFRGDHIISKEYCVYCDDCGSFKVTRFPSHRKVMRFLLVVLIAVVFSWIITRATPESSGAWFVIIVMFEIIGIVGIFQLFTSGLRCGKCGHAIKQGSGNSRNYAEYDRKVIDVPYQETHRYYYEDY